MRGYTGFIGAVVRPRTLLDAGRDPRTVMAITGNESETFAAPSYPARVAGAAERPLGGTNFVVKDLIDVAGEVTGAGNSHWRRTQPAAMRNAPDVDRLLRNGASLVGRTLWTN